MSRLVALVAFHVVLSVTFGTVLGQMTDLFAAVALLFGGLTGAVSGHMSRLLTVVTPGSVSVSVVSIVGSSVSVISVLVSVLSFDSLRWAGSGDVANTVAVVTLDLAVVVFSGS